MRTRYLVVLAALIVLIGGLVMATPVMAEKSVIDLDDRAKSVPGELNYQGYLAAAADSSAITATLEMTFRLFDSETKGAQLWSEIHPAVEVNGGLFQVLLGSVTPFPAGLFDGTALWLQTEVAAEVFAPRKPLVSVAYSHRTNSAEMLLDLTLTDLDDRWVNEQDLDHLDAADGNPADAVYVDDAGKVGIGTTTPATQLDVNGSINATTYFGDGSNLTGISAAPDSDWTISGSDMYAGVSGNVGIGASVPSYKLHVIGEDHELLRLGTVHANSHINIETRPSGAGGLQIKAIGGNNHIALFPGSTERVRFTASGDVGIGTINPSRNLHIYENADGVVGIDIENPNTGNGSIEMITLTDENGGVAGMAAYDDGGTYPSALRIYNNRPNGNLGLVAGGAERVRISNGGDVGIGTTSPGHRLDVNGAVNATTYWGDGSNLTGIAGTPDADWTVSGDTIYHQTGIVGIGTACPAYPLHVYNYAGYSPALAGYFNAVGHEATGTAHAIYAVAAADDENAYGIYSTATSTWGQAYAGYFDGDVQVDGKIQADTLALGSSAKAGTDGILDLYRGGSADPIVSIGGHSNYGGRIHLVDDAGIVHSYFEPDVGGEGGYLEVMRNSTYSGFYVDGNLGGTGEPLVVIEGSAREVTFQMNQSGDASVLLPPDAISSGEIKDEPGVSNSLGPSFYNLSSGNIDYAVDTVAITIPGPGYVEVTGGCYLALDHSVGTDTRVFVAIDKTPASASFTFPGAQVANVPGVIPSSDWGFPCTTTRFYEEGTAGTKTYYLNVDYNSGTSVNTAAARTYLRATYYPTLYGTVTMAETDGVGDDLSSAQGAWDGSVRGPEPRRRSITVEDHNARLEAEMAALRAELEALKEEVQNQRR